MKKKKTYVDVPKKIGSKWALVEDCGLSDRPEYDPFPEDGPAYDAYVHFPKGTECVILTDVIGVRQCVRVLPTNQVGWVNIDCLP